MASLPPNDQVVFIMNVLQNTEMSKPDYHAVARNTGSTNANTAQKKFKAIAKAAGFDLVNDRIIRSGDPAIPSPPAASRAKKGAAGGKAANSTPKKKTTNNDDTPVKGNKKRKIDDVAKDFMDEMAGNDEQSTAEESVEQGNLEG